MRSLKFALVALAATVTFGAASAEPVKIRMAWVAPVSNWASIVLEKKDLAIHMGARIVLACEFYALAAFKLLTAENAEKYRGERGENAATFRRYGTSAPATTLMTPGSRISIPIPGA